MYWFFSFFIFLICCNRFELVHSFVSADHIAGIYRVLRAALLIVLICGILWSINNYLFYVNLYILSTHPDFNYSFIQNIIISSKLTDEYQTTWFYFHHIINKNFDIDHYFPEFAQQVQKIVDQLSNLSEIESNLSLTTDILRYLF